MGLKRRSTGTRDLSSPIDSGQKSCEKSPLKRILLCQALLKDDQVDLECLGLPRLQLRYSFHLKRIRSLPFRAAMFSVLGSGGRQFHNASLQRHREAAEPQHVTREGGFCQVF